MLLRSLIIFFFCVPLLFADVVVLQDGKRVEGRIIRNKGGQVEIDVEGVCVTYFYDDIAHLETADGEAPATGQDAVSLNSAAIRENGPEDAKGWIKSHHGIILYQDHSSDHYDMASLSALAKKSGTRSVKTWLKGNEAGEILQKASRSDYKRLFDSFDVVALNVCPDYMLRRWDERRSFEPTTSRDVESDFYQLAKFLINAYNGQNKIFIINYFFEINVYAGTPESGRPDFPVVDFILSAQGGVKRAIAEIPLKNLRILDCIEVNCDHGHFLFVKNIFPLVRTDLYSLSYYGEAPIKSYLDYWAKNAPDSPVFGNKNIMVGEYGIKLEDGRVNGSEEKQAQYLKGVRDIARSWGVPYIFLFWLADQDSKVSTEGSFGLVGLKGQPRKAWQELYAAYH